MLYAQLHALLCTHNPCTNIVRGSKNLESLFRLLAPAGLSLYSQNTNYYYFYKRGKYFTASRNLITSPFIMEDYHFRDLRYYSYRIVRPARPLKRASLKLPLWKRILLY